MVSRFLLGLFIGVLGFGSLTVNAAAEGKAPKEWAFLLFLNGNNNLAEYGDLNINQMETVGSSNDVDFVVQWAKLGVENTYRLKVERDNDDKKVTSPIVETLPRVDMGDYKELVKFVQWSVEHYPAKHYFIAFWNHGSGWHRRGDELTRGISYDDYSGNHITTLQMGTAMKEISALIGHKVDIVGADACLMAMVEVANEMSDYVGTFVASEETEPALGWPYHTFADKWTKNPMASANEVGTYLVDEYYAYLGHKTGITLSAMDLTKMDQLVKTFNDASGQLGNLSATSLSKLKEAGTGAQSFAYSDYVDLSHWLTKVTGALAEGSINQVLGAITKSVESLVVHSKASSDMPDAKGAAFWLPMNSFTMNMYAEDYSKLKFAQSTGWLNILKKLNSR